VLIFVVIVMFIRVIKVKNHSYLNIIETFRQGGKVKQRSLGSLGRVDKLKTSGQLIKLALNLLEFAQKKVLLLDNLKLKEISRKNWGAVRILKKIWDDFKFPALFKSITSSRKIQFDFFSAVSLMLLDRLIQPQSKLKSFQKQDYYYQIKTNALQHLYRALDLLAENKEKIENFLFERNVSLFNMSVDVVLYDVTTLYFESVRKDDLRDFGFSKDCKINEVQIILGLLVDLEGRPVGFDLFAGNQFEGHTLKHALEKIKQRFAVNQVIFIGDQAMFSRANLKLISEAKERYIMGARLRNKSREIKEQVLNPEGYSTLVSNEEEIFKFKEIKNGEDRLIVSWSKKRAEKDKKDRERLILKAQKMLENGSQIISRRGALKYLEIKSEVNPELNTKRIEEEEKWDGYYAIQSNCPELEGAKLLDYYHQLWKIEESFRIFKSHLETRPIFHWTARRIKGHLVLCFMAFLLERTLELELKSQGVEYSAQRIREALSSLEFSQIELEGQTFYLRSAVEGLANELLRAFKIKIPPSLSTPKNF